MSASSGRKTLAANLFAVAALCSACGGGGGNSSPDPPPSSVRKNLPPVLVHPNADQVAIKGEQFDYNAGQIEDVVTFSDPEGEPLLYRIHAPGMLPGFATLGAEIEGTPTRTGAFTVTITATDSAGGSASDSFEIAVYERPMLIRPNEFQLVTVGEAVDYDPTQGGLTFAQMPEDPLIYEVTLLTPGRGLRVRGTQVIGVMDSVGLVRVRITATNHGGLAEDVFGIVAPAPEPGAPVLPETMFVYADEALPLPHAFRLSSELGIPFWDTTPPDNRTTDAGATLGRVLFYDKRLSVTNTASCGSCHRQSLGFSTPTRFSEGFQGDPTKRNAMPLTNVRYNIRDRYFSDMRAETLEKLALMPIEDPIELGNRLGLLEQKLAATASYPSLFEAAFGSSDITVDRIARALAQFLRSLISFRSKFDSVYHDPTGATPDPATVFTPQELAGEGIFMGHCIVCHKNGVHTMDDPSNNGLDAEPTDPGIVGLHPGNFRFASLRNVAVSAPYMHDGRFSTLREVIDHYDSGVQLSPGLADFLESTLPDGTSVPRVMNLTEEDKLALEAFLHTLTDEHFLTDPRFSDPFQ